MDTNEDLAFLKSMVMERRLHLLVKIHAVLRRFGRVNPVPYRDNAESLASNMSKELGNGPDCADCSELIHLLSSPHVKALLSVHDVVARKTYDPELPPMDGDTADEESVRIVSLVKSQEPLGATLKRDGSTGAIVVARVMKGGTADLTGLIHEGDELREVNGVPVENKNPEEILPIMAGTQGEVTFKVIPAAAAKGETSANESKLFVRALFDYDPELDTATPCRAAGLSFKRGDVLEIFGHDDDIWWQARRYGDRSPRAGLIPTRQLQERRVAFQRPKALFKSHKIQKQLTENADYGAITGIHIAGLRRSFRLGRRASRSIEESRWKIREILGECQAPTYLEVAPYCWDATQHHRLVLLVGPRGVGLSELKRRLLLSDPDHFGVAVPYTTREKRKEEEGVEYYFVSRQTFELDIVNHKFIEYGHHSGNYYGISLDSVHKVIAEGKVCLLDVQPHAIQFLHTAEFKPYVVFVKPPSIEKLRFSRRKAKFIATKEQRPTTSFKEEDFEVMIAEAEAMDDQYGHLFQKVLVNCDIVSAFDELRAELRKLEGAEPQWIPVEWTAVPIAETLC
ncbi:hypothetical protein DPEC_G00055140 [Dallia pectoralis]|uniref:Uncharacterized protein n=1 Tax=Dallia pectoralis TaxID=75939 RepID=A0ACC2H5U0_DALPE|nr:hypothetical protein DPEC_G00055140 [Dallia pectoralis]